jgi:hypothetical protein
MDRLTGAAVWWTGGCTTASGTGLSMNVVRTMPPCPAASSERSCRDLRSPELTVKRDASNEHCGSYPNARLGLALTGWNGASEYS